MNRKSASSASLRLTTLPALALAVFFVLGVPVSHAAQKYQYTSQLCTDCHGMPPIDAAYRNVTTGGFRGSHLTHATTVQSSCEKCHNSSSTFTTSHSDGFIHMSSNINASPAPAKGVYSTKGVFFNQTSNPVLGSCTNVNCHFETTTPTWSSTTFASPGDCGQCHGAPPSGSGPGYTGGTAGSHSKHNLYYTGATKCVKCHTDHTAEANTFAHATSLRNIVVAPREPDGAGALAGSYSGTGAKFLPSQQASQSFGTCSGTYCHTNGQSATGPYTHTAIQWGGSTTCTSCHDGAAAITTLSGKHQKHVGTTVYAFTCNYCHYNTTNNGSTISDYTLHVNKSKDVTFDPVVRTSTSSWDGSQCVNIYCHGNGQSLTPTDTVNWSSTTSCWSCHAYPTITSGSHTKHAIDQNTCTKCHNDTVDTGMGALKSYTLHVNRSVDIKLNAGFTENIPRYNGYSIAKNYSKAAGSGFARCSSLYCHSDGKRNATYRSYSSKTWGSSGIGCTGCHGTNNSTGAPGYTSGSGYENSHGKHVSGSADCVKCHFKTTTTGTSIPGGPMPSASSLHLNGTPDVNLSKPFTYATYSGVYNSGAKTCSATYCHGSTTTPAWGSSTQCNSCHSAANSGYWAANSAHLIHLESSTILPGKYANYSGNVSSASAYRFTCSSCHSQQGGATHVNGPRSANYAAEVFFGYTAKGRVGTYVYGTTQGTTDSNLTWTNNGGGCNTTYCHSDGTGTNGNDTQTGRWNVTTNSATATRCKACHGYTTASGTQIVTGYHDKHVNSAAYNMSCAKCHNATTTDGTSIADKSKHVNKVKDVVWDATNSDGTAYVNSATACANIYCHSLGTSTTQPYAAPLTTVKWSSSPAITCSGCHDTKQTGATPTGLSGKHDKHMNPTTNSMIGLSNGFNCIDCHAKTVSNNTTIANRANHVNKFIDFSSVRGGGSAKYTTATKLCTNIYCHSNGNAGSLVYQNPAAWNSATTYGCNGCHGTTNPTTGAPDYVNGGAGTATANSHPAHIAKLGYTDTTGCAVCHVKTADTATGGRFKDYTAASYHISGGPNVVFKSIGGKTGSTNVSGYTVTCSNTYCHGTGPSAVWGSPSLACNSCHSANNTLPGAHQIHVQTASLASTYANMSGNVSTATQYRFSCAACHSSVKGAKHANGPANTNGPAEVFFGFTSATMKGGSYNYGASSAGTDPTGGFSYTGGGSNAGACNNSYCHSNGQGSNGLATVAWSTTASTGTCVQCHDTKQTGATPTGLSGKHDKHMNPTSNVSLGLNNGFNCIDCHAKTVSGNTTIANKANHVNKFIDFSSVKGGGSAKYSSATKLCTNIYCHSNGNAGAIVYQNPAAWNSATTYSCNGCHGTTNPTTGAPDYVSGGAGTATANSHPTHITKLSITDTIGCAKCHYRTVDSTTANKLRNYSTQHLNGTANIKFSGLAGVQGRYSSNSQQCVNTYCHSDGTSVSTGTIPANTSLKWGGSSTCSSCHGAPPQYRSGIPKMNSHTSARGHKFVIATSTALTCDTCHNSVTYSGGVYTTNPTLHDSGSYNVQASLGYTFATTGGTCATPGNGCHGPTQGTWGGHLGCIDCHSKTITRTMGRPGTTLANVVGEFGLAWGHKKSGRGAVTDDDCIVCHLEGDGTTHKPSAKHMDGNIDLRDPDGAGETPITNISGGVFTFQRFSTSYAAGTRTSTGNTSNTDIANVITQKFCLACHSSNGATNPTARSNNGGTGTQYMPFGGINLGVNYTVANGAAVAGGLVDVKTELATTNSSYHPVAGPLNRDYPTAARMNDPYKPAGTRGTSGTLTASVVINCFDCHNQVGTPLTLRTVAAHGNAVTLRGVATVSGTPSSSNKVTFCVVCHNSYDAAITTAHGSGSAFNSSVDSAMNPYLQYACNVCHGSAYTGVVSPVRAQDVHGVNALPTGGSAPLIGSRWAGASMGTPAQVNTKPYAFIRNTKDLGTHNPNKIGGSTYTPQCEMGPNNVSGPTCTNQGLQNYTPGGSF